MSKKLKRLWKSTIAFVCTIVMLAGGVFTNVTPALAAGDIYNVTSYAPEGYENVAKGKSVTASSSYEAVSEGWSKTLLVDEKVGQNGVANGWTTDPFAKVMDQNKEAWVTIDLGQEYDIKQIGVFPRSGGTYGICFPVDFQVRVSSDNATWSELYSATGAATPEGPVIVSLEETVKGQYVQVYVSKRTATPSGSDGYLVSLAEVAVWGKEPAAEPETDIYNVTSYAPEGYENVAKGKSVTASSSYEAVSEGWSKTLLVDEKVGQNGVANGWTTDPFEKVMDRNKEAWVTIDLGQEYDIKQIGVFPRSGGTYGICFPVDFQVRVSSDNATWSELYSATGAATPEGPVIVSLKETVKGQYVQVYVSKRTATPSGSDGYLVSLAEVAVWGKEPAAEPVKDRMDITAFAPEGYDNIAIGKNVTASSTYEAASDGWCKAYLVDGILGKAEAANGWITDPFEKVMDRNKEAWVTIDLGQEYDIKQVGLFPRSGGSYGECFPVDFQVRVSSDNTTWSEIYNATGMAKPEAPVIAELEETVKGQYVQLYVSKRTETTSGKDGYLVCLSEMAVWGKLLEKDKYDINAYAPEGIDNIALNKNVTASSTYEKAKEGWQKSNLVDGIVAQPGKANGWTTDPYEQVTDPTVPAWVTIDLAKDYDIKQVGLFPRGDGAYGANFPVDFQIKVSFDNEVWSEVYNVTGTPTPEGPVIIEMPENVSGQYIQLYVSRRLAVDNEGDAQASDGMLAQMSEMAVWGVPSTTVRVSLNKTSIRLLPGETDTITPVIKPEGTEDLTLVWSSDNEAVATVSQDGVITAVAVGKTLIHVKNAEHEIELDVEVEVVNSKFSYDDNILIAIFWPPTLEYMSTGEGDELWDEQYKLLANADIDFINNVTGNDLNAKSTNLKMLKYADKYGMVVSVADERFKPASLQSMTQEQIEALIAEYRNVPGVGGYYICDEPKNANPYLDVYVAMKNADSKGYAHLNFLPCTSYSSLEVYKNQMRDWLRLSEAAGYPQDYLMFDLYPYPDNSTGMRREAFLNNLSAVWEVGKEFDVKTATYLQSVRIPGVYRCPSVDEIRYEAMLSLAYGYKQVSYFTWFTPSNRSEPFENGIILLNGKPNEKLYGGICELNKEIHGLGNVLINLDAEEVYLNGTTWGQKSIPADFFAQPLDATNYTVSFMRDKKTGRNYLMLVNNSYDAAASFSLKLDSKIQSLEEVSKVDGSLASYALAADGTLDVALEAGDGILFALPEGVDYYESGITEQENGQNLALDAYVIVDSSVGENNAYISNLNDGVRSKSTTSDGWTSQEVNAVITMDLRTERTFNRVDIYSSGENLQYGDDLPKAFEIQVSKDGVNYETVATETNFGEDGLPGTVSFEKQTARYVRLVITESQGEKLSIAEIEVYLDDGSVPKPKDQRDMQGIVDYVAGENIALNKKVFVSSTTPDNPYAQWGWSAKFANDGKTDNGWTTMTGVNKTNPNAEEWVIVDLGDNFSIDEVKIMPRGSFAIDYTVEISKNGKSDWQTIADIKDDVGNADLTWRDFITTADESGEKPTGRYLRMKSSKLKVSGNDGYLMQIAEIEAYGTPSTDKTEAEEVINEAETLKDGVQVDTTALEDAMQALSDAIDSELTTQRKLDELVEKVKVEMAAVKIAQEEYEASLHRHVFDQDWKFDEDNHWHECSCSEKADVDAHSYGEWTEKEKGTKERTCSVCGYTDSEKVDVVEPSEPSEPSEPTTPSTPSNTTPSTDSFDQTENESNKDDDDPETGDDNNPMLWIVVLLVSCIGMVGATISLRKKQTER